MRLEASAEGRFVVLQPSLMKAQMATCIRGIR